MNPFLPAGSKVLVSRIATDRVVRGDLLVYEAEEALIAHRVLRRRSRGRGYAFLTKGDAWRAIESWIQPSQVVGKVIAVELNGKVSRIDTFQRRLCAANIALLSLAAVKTLAAWRWGKRVLQEQRKQRQKV